MWTKQCLFISGKLVHECPNASCASDRGCDAEQHWGFVGADLRACM